MFHRDAGVRLQLVCLRQCLRWLLAGIDWSAIRFRKDCHWTPKTLVAGALLWAWSDESTLVERFATVRKIASRLDDEQQQLAKSYQAFTKILRRWTDDLVLLVMEALHERMQQALPHHWQVGNFVLYGANENLVVMLTSGGNDPARDATLFARFRVTRRRLVARRVTRAHLKILNSTSVSGRHHFSD